MEEILACAEKKHPGGKLVKVCIKSTGSRVRGVILTGDFFVEPEESFDDILKKLRELSCELHEADTLVARLLESSGVKIYGLTIEDVRDAVMNAIKRVEEISSTCNR